MGKSLEELCLTFVSRNIKSFPRLGVRLSARHKAMLLERMCSHGERVEEPIVFFFFFFRMGVVDSLQELHTCRLHFQYYLWFCLCQRCF